MGKDRASRIARQRGKVLYRLETQKMRHTVAWESGFGHCAIKGLTDELIDGRTDQRTDGRTDKASCREMLGRI